MNKAITDGLVLTPPKFELGLGVWSSENGTASITRKVLKALWVFIYSNTRMSTMVTGIMSFSRSRTRSMFSYCPLQISE